uniref:Uncharacterized protein n=1 Tax=Arundo donax TaxID=35708 RepID=A0A0A9BX11_ARUDO
MFVYNHLVCNVSLCIYVLMPLAWLVV